MDGPDGITLRLLRTEVMTIDRGWAARDVCSSYWRCYHNEAPGAAIDLATGGSWDIDPDAVHLIPAWVGFSCRCEAEAVPHWYAHVDLVGWPSSLVAPAFPAPIAVRDPAVLGLVRSVADRARAGGPCLAVQAGAKAVAAAALAEALAELPDVHRLRLEPVERAGPLAPVIDHVGAHLGDDLDNRQLAAVAGCSSDHLIRLFKQRLGQTPAQYVQERRVADAAERLLKTDDSIDQIAASTGFANRYHFSRIFARLLGCPPARYRKTDRV